MLRIVVDLNLGLELCHIVLQVLDAFEELPMVLGVLRPHSGEFLTKDRQGNNKLRDGCVELDDRRYHNDRSSEQGQTPEDVRVHRPPPISSLLRLGMLREFSTSRSRVGRWVCFRLLPE